VWLGHVTVTGAELYLSAASWSFEAELMDPERRGEYSGAAGLSGTLGKVWAPAVYTFLAMSWGSVGWLLIAGIVVAATVGLHRSARWAQAFLVKNGIHPDREPGEAAATPVPPSLLQEPPLAPAAGGNGPTTTD
jgi:MFS family permease